MDVNKQMGTTRTTRTTTRITLTLLFLAAAAGITYRVERASEFGWFEAATSIGTVLLIAGAVTTGWRVHVHKLNALHAAEAAEWKAARQRRADTLLDGEEDRALWDSVPAAETNLEDTCAFGNVVVPLNRFRYPEAG